MSFPLPVVGSSAKDGDGASALSLPFTAQKVIKISLDCEQSLFFFRFSKGSVRARERCAFSHARGHLRVSGVLLDGPRKKKDCS